MSLPKRHPSRADQMAKKPGKTGQSAGKIGCGIGKLTVCENRREPAADACAVFEPMDPPRPPSSVALGIPSRNVRRRSDRKRA